MTRPHVVALATLGRLGGAERSLLEVVRRLDGDFRFTVVVPEDGPLGGAVRDAGAACVVVPWPEAFATLGERTGGTRIVGMLRAAASMGVLRTRLVAALAHLAPDVLVTNGVKAHLLGALVRGLVDRPVVWCAREGVEDRPLSRLVLRQAARRCDGVIAISRYVAGQFRPLVPGPAPIHVVRNIVDLRAVRPGLSSPPDLTKPAGAFWIGIVGALTPLKGQDLFLDAAARVAARVPAARFVVVGGEPYRTEARLGFGATLAARARALGIAERVDFLGERDDAPAIIANLDVLVQANRGPEGLGRAVLEAMACGVPVIAVDRWGPRELVQDGATGFLVAPGDVAALAERIERLATAPALRTALGAAGRRAILADGDPARLAAAFRDALRAIAGLPAPRLDASQDVAVGGR